MKRGLLALLLMVPMGARAESSDAAYCAKLAELMNTYLGGDMGRPAITDSETAVAIDRCQKGDTAAGIPVLERKLKASGYTLPKR
jgi:hypothetical protein